MLAKQIQDKLNAQINHEFYSAYVYLAMSAYCETLNLPGFAHWMQEQAKEETTHAMRIYAHVHDCGGTVLLDKIDKLAGVVEQSFTVANQVENQGLPEWITSAGAGVGGAVLALLGVLGFR